MGAWQGLMKSEIIEQYSDAYECLMNAPNFIGMRRLYPS